MCPSTLTSFSLTHHPSILPHSLTTLDIPLIAHIPQTLRPTTATRVIQGSVTKKTGNRMYKCKCKNTSLSHSFLLLDSLSFLLSSLSLVFLSSFSLSFYLFCFLPSFVSDEEMTRDEWVESSYIDDSLVAELLMRLKHSEAEPSLVVKKRAPVPVLDWAVRQPRSRQISRGDIVKSSKKGESNRASPTTPLSWSAGTSNSGGTADGCEESSRFHTSTSRSKGISTSETWIKQSRRRKTFPELQEEESFLMKGKIDLNTLDYPFQSANKMGIEASSKSSKKPRYDQSYLRETVTFEHTPSVLGTSGKCNNQNPVVCTSSTLVDSHKAQTDSAMNRVILPDLNLPVEEDSNSETLYGMS